MSEIREFVFNKPIFETHEHLCNFQEFDEGRTEHLEDRGFRDFLSYAKDDMQTAAGIEHDLLKDNPDDKTFFKMWEHVRTTGYGQAVHLGIQKLFNQTLTLESSESITDQVLEFMKDRSAKEIFEVIYRKANIVGAIVDRYEDSYKDLTVFSGNNYPPFFKQTLRLDAFINIDSLEKIQGLEKDFKTSITTLPELLNVIHTHTEKANQTGNMAAFKIAVAYQRNLQFEKPPQETAVKIFDRLRVGKEIEVTPLQDFIAHYIIQLAEEFKKPLQIHTGHLAGPWHDIRNSNPSDLIPLFQHYKNVRFDIFHAGWPYSDIMGSIAKNFPNVWLDMCWAWAMNPIQMERTLDEWLACVPSNKIFGFGGDTRNPFSIIGYAEQTRNGIANVLEKKVSTGEYDLETAQFVAERILHKNAEEFFDAV